VWEALGEAGGVGGSCLAGCGDDLRQMGHEGPQRYLPSLSDVVRCGGRSRAGW
jgi:hypothetical protein